MSASLDLPRSPLALFVPPYRTLQPAEVTASGGSSDAGPAAPGTVWIWNLAVGRWGSTFRTVRDRPGGVALVMILPPADRLESVPALLEAAEHCRPHSVLPHHGRPSPDDLRAVLLRRPDDLALEFTDYLAWRGLQVDLDTRRLVRKTVELSAELRTVSGLARALYLSRRALGRRFRKHGLPVPSHVLHFCRILRASFELQRSPDSLFDVARSLGYPDGFSLSNQMARLTGLRPNTVRDSLGWEWIVEAWLRTEAEDGRVELSDSVRLPRPRDEALSPRAPDLARGGPVWRRSGGRRAGSGSSGRRLPVGEAE